MDVDIPARSSPGGQYNRPRDAHLLAVQEEIAEEILETLQPRISGEAAPRHAPSTRRTPRTSSSTSRAATHWNKGTIRGLQARYRLLPAGDQQEPNYAHGVRSDLPTLYSIVSARTGSRTLPEAKAAAEQALAIDNSLSELRTSPSAHQARCSTGTGRPPSARSSRGSAESEFRARARPVRGNYLQRSAGRLDDALSQVRRAQELELRLLARSSTATSGAICSYAGQDDEAIAQFRKTLEFIDFRPRAAASASPSSANDQHMEAIAEAEAGVDAVGEQPPLSSATSAPRTPAPASAPRPKGCPKQLTAMAAQQDNVPSVRR